MTAGNRTMYADLRDGASAVYRVITQSGYAPAATYVVGFHVDGNRRHVIVHSPGLNVIMRDSDPRIGQQSLFDVPPADWVGHSLQIATMTTTPVVAVLPEMDPAALTAVGHGQRPANAADGGNPFARPAPPPPPPTLVDPPGAVWPLVSGGGMPDQPCIVPQPARGTAIAELAPEVLMRPGPRPGPAPMPAPAPMPGPAPSHGEIPYPLRQVGYAESCVDYLRALVRRERLFVDLADMPDQRARLRAALDERATLLEQLRRRDR